MSESAVERVELENGVTLGEILQDEVHGYKLSKEEVRTVFLGTVDKIFCHCAVQSCEIPTCGETFDVQRNNLGGLWIGCVYFNAEQVAAVKKWLGE